MQFRLRKPGQHRIERHRQGTVGRNQALSYFFKVEPGTPAFKVDFSGPSATPGTGQARFLRFHPFGVGIDSNTSTVCYSPPVPGGSCPPAGGLMGVYAGPVLVQGASVGIPEIGAGTITTADGRYSFTVDVSALPATPADSLQALLAAD